MELLPEDGAGQAMLRDAEAAEAAILATLKAAWAQSQADNQAVKESLARPAEEF